MTWLSLGWGLELAQALLTPGIGISGLVFVLMCFLFVHLFCYGSFIYFEIVSFYIAQAGLKFLILLSQPSETSPHRALFCCVILREFLPHSGPQLSCVT